MIDISPIPLRREGAHPGNDTGAIFEIVCVIQYKSHCVLTLSLPRKVKRFIFLQYVMCENTGSTIAMQREYGYRIENNNEISLAIYGNGYIGETDFMKMN
jgi:hypothetical protein